MPASSLQLLVACKELGSPNYRTEGVPFTWTIWDCPLKRVIGPALSMWTTGTNQEPPLRLFFSMLRDEGLSVFFGVFPRNDTREAGAVLHSLYPAYGSQDG